MQNAFDIIEDERLYFVPVIYPNVQPNMYEVNPYGDVRNIITNRVLKYGYYGGKNHDDYIKYTLKCDDMCSKRNMTVPAHRLVAHHFVINPYNLPIVNHKTNDTQKNYYKDLEWCTHSYNTNYSLSQGRLPRGENSYLAKTSEKEVILICEALQSGMSIRDIAEKVLKSDYATWASRIIGIRQGKSWNHISCNYTFNYSNRSSIVSRKCDESTLHDIARLISLGYAPKDIVNDLGLDKSFRNVINGMKNGTHYQNIYNLYKDKGSTTIESTSIDGSE